MPYTYGSSGARRSDTSRYGLSETQLRNLISLHRDNQAAQYVPLAQKDYADVAKEQQEMERARKANVGGGREAIDDSSPAWYEKVAQPFAKGLELINRPFEFMGGAAAAQVETTPDWVKNTPVIRELAHIPLGAVGVAKVLTPGISDIERDMGAKEDQSYREQLGQTITYQNERDPRYWGDKFITETLASGPLMLLGTGISPLRGLSLTAKAARAGKVARGIEAAERAYIATETYPLRLVGRNVKAGARKIGLTRVSSAAAHKPIERLDTWLGKERTGFRGVAMAPLRGILGPVSKGLANESDRSMVRNVPSRVSDVLTHMTRRAVLRTGAEEIAQEGGKTVDNALFDVLSTVEEATRPRVSRRTARYRGQVGQQNEAIRRLNSLREGIGEADDIGRVGSSKDYATFDALVEQTTKNDDVRDAVKGAIGKANNGDQDGAYQDVAYAVQKAIAKEKKVKLFDRPTGPAGWGNKLYNFWRMAVLSTPWYVLQNGVENNLRLLERHGPRGLQGLKRTNHDYFMSLDPPEAIMRSAARGKVSYAVKGRPGLRKGMGRTARQETDQPAAVTAEQFTQGWQDNPLGMMTRAGGAFDGNAYERSFVVSYDKHLEALRNNPAELVEMFGDEGYEALRVFDEQIDSILDQIGTYAGAEDLSRLRSMVADAKATPGGAKKLMSNVNTVMNNGIRDVLDPAKGKNSLIPSSLSTRLSAAVRYSWKEAQTQDVSNVAKRVTARFNAVKGELASNMQVAAAQQYSYLKKTGAELSKRLRTPSADIDPKIAETLRLDADEIFAKVERNIGAEDIDIDALLKADDLPALRSLFGNHIAHDRTAMAQVRMDMVLQLEDRAKHGMDLGEFNKLYRDLDNTIQRLENDALRDKELFLLPIRKATSCSSPCGPLYGVKGTADEATKVKAFLDENEDVLRAFQEGNYGDDAYDVNHIWRTYFRKRAHFYRDLPSNAREEIAKRLGNGTQIPKMPSPHVDDYFNAVNKEVDDWAKEVIARFHEVKPGTGKIRETQFDVQTSSLAEKAYNETVSAQMEQVARLLDDGATQYRRMHDVAKRRATRTTLDTFGNPAVRMNVDELMGNLGVPFFFFPSRSMAYYAQAAVRRPALLPTIKRYQNSVKEEDDPAYLAGSFKLPTTVGGADLYVNPLKSYMGWQMFGQADFLPRNAPMYEQILRTSQNTLGIGFGPIHTILPRLFESMVLDENKEGIDLVSNSPQFLIPQQKWFKTLERADLGILSTTARLLNVPTDHYMNTVFGNEIPNWLERRTEKQLVQRGHNPATATDEQLDGALRDVWWQTLAGIPLGSTVHAVSPLAGDRTADLITNLDARGDGSLEMLREGKNPFSGLRRDDIDSMFQGIDKEEIYGYIRPATLTPEMTPHWNAHVKLQLNLQKSRDELTSTMDALNAKWSSDPTMSGFQWDELRKEAYAKYGTQIDTLYKSHPLAPRSVVSEELAQRGGITWNDYRKELGKDERVVHKHDQLYDSFVQQVLAREFDDATGEFDYDKYERAYEGVFSSSNMADIGIVGEEEQASAKAYVLAKRFQNLTAPEKERKRLIELARPYWQVPDTIMDSFGATKTQKEAYRRWKTAPSGYKDSIPLSVGLSTSFFKQIDSVATRAKNKLREENRTIDAYLVRYKNYKPRHPAHQIAGVEQQIQNINLNLEELIPGLQLYTVAT